MAVKTGEVDYVNTPGGGCGGFGGFGSGFGLFGLVGLNSLWGQNGFNNGLNGNGAIPGITVLEQNVSELMRDVQGVNTEVHKLGNELQMSFNASNMNIANNFRNLDNQICGIDKTVMQGNFALSQQMSNFQHATDQQFCAVKEQIAADGQATRSLITQNLIDDLRSQLAGERRGRDNREVEINIQNSANATQAQLQNQLQQQRQELSTFMNVVGDQLARQTNSVVNLGSMIGSGQSNSAAQTKVNS